MDTRILTDKDQQHIMAILKCPPLTRAMVCRDLVAPSPTGNPVKLTMGDCVSIYKRNAETGVIYLRVTHTGGFVVATCVDLLDIDLAPIRKT